MCPPNFFWFCYYSKNITWCLNSWQLFNGKITVLQIEHPTSRNPKSEMHQNPTLLTTDMVLKRSAHRSILDLKFFRCGMLTQYIYCKYSKIKNVGTPKHLVLSFLHKEHFICMNYRHEAVQEISRTSSTCPTETTQPWSNALFPWPQLLETTILLSDSLWNPLRWGT